MPYLKWIDDATITTIVLDLLNNAQAAQKEAEEDFNKNVIDPFAALFETAGFKLGHGQWIESEKTRKAQKTLQNHIGQFHQTILGHVKGWSNMRTGKVFDLVNDEKKILAELKNKYNTVSGGSLSGVYTKLDEQISPKHSHYKGYTAYYVVIIPRKPERYNIPFTPSDGTKGSSKPLNEKLRSIDGASFYHLVTGEPNALENLFDILPQVISDCSGGKHKINDKRKLKEFFDLAFKA
jgi:hypothetical protein